MHMCILYAHSCIHACLQRPENTLRCQTLSLLRWVLHWYGWPVRPRDPCLHSYKHVTIPGCRTIFSNKLFLLLFLYVNVCMYAFATLTVWVMRITVIRLGCKVFTCCSILPATEQNILKKKEKRMWIPTSSHSAARTVFIRSSSTPETTW